MSSRSREKLNKYNHRGKGNFGPNTNFEEVTVYNEQTKQDERHIIKMLNRDDRALILHQRKQKRMFSNAK